ncbi:MAG: DUF1836 domain-containing protein [Clostridia bacterium]|nr:DUF1836 domain-containing protein [Clostridia bacterium]
MNIEIDNPLIPGTVLKRKDMGNATGLEFLNKIFYITDGIMLNQIRDISGIDGTTLQNWTKRGWVASSKLKRYDKDQLAHILIINMLRACMQLDRIAFLIRYINGSVTDHKDDIIRDSELYDYICRILDRLMEGGSCNPEGLRLCISEVTANYEERISGARRRLERALEIIVFAYYASILKQHSDRMTEKLMQV